MKLLIQGNPRLTRFVMAVIGIVERIEDGAFKQKIDLIKRIEARQAFASDQIDPTDRIQMFLRHRRKVATIGLAALALLFAFRVVLGTNGTLAYTQKRSEYKSLQKEVERLEKENQELAERNKSLKSSPEAIEREAREQLRYAKPGEVILMFPGADPSAASASTAAQKR
ncbi:MAG TPA: septum formation initiator family protein [Terriglobales bacterium]|jgi:cell division protein FtsB|nr:septum formation initiator family protein [Terriglobales bacterium]